LNHLAHALIADRSRGSIAGHLLGDFVKGSPEGRYRGELLEGIRAHRRVDAFTDAHPRVALAVRRFEPPYRRFAGILVDLFFDHALARSWEEWSRESLRAFADRVYAELEMARADLPEEMRRFAGYMTSSDLLVAYRDPAGLARALAGMSRRMRRPNPLAGAAAVMEVRRAALEADFRAFFPELLAAFAPDR
jgi:acyl carrier protein phosphodiesterase